MQSMLTIFQPSAATASRAIGQHFGRVAAAVLGVGVGEHLAHVAQGGGAQQGVDQGVQQRVGVAMADRLPIVGNVDAAQSQWSARLQPVGIVSDSYPHSVRGLVSLCWPLFHSRVRRLSSKRDVKG